MSKGAAKRLAFNQLLIFSVTCFVYFSGRADFNRALVLFVLMQIGAIIGTWWGNRVQQQMAADRNKLPLDRR